eukprot:364260-Chlamydomonas_euryale.AAC.6
MQFSWLSASTPLYVQRPPSSRAPQTSAKQAGTHKMPELGRCPFVGQTRAIRLKRWACFASSSGRGCGF